MATTGTRQGHPKTQRNTLEHHAPRRTLLLNGHGQGVGCSNWTHTKPKARQQQQHEASKRTSLMNGTHVTTSGDGGPKTPATTPAGCQPTHAHSLHVFINATVTLIYIRSSSIKGCPGKPSAQGLLLACKVLDIKRHPKRLRVTCRMSHHNVCT